MQGFYFGKPLPEEEACERRQDRSLKIETMQEALLFSQAGLIDVSRVLPVAIVFDDGQDVRILQCNAAYRKTLRSTGTKNLADRTTFSALRISPCGRNSAVSSTKPKQAAKQSR